MSREPERPTAVPPSPPLRVRVLGSGTSMGVPVIGCDCPVCTSNDPMNHRLRSSIAIEVGESWLLVDCSIDFRQQMLRWPLPRIDAVLLTHTHSDHVNGIDDLRPYNYRQRGAIPFFGRSDALADIERRFGYAFDPPQRGGGVPQMQLTPVQPGCPFEVGGVTILPIDIMHGRMSILGFRIGRFAYLTDCSGIPPASEALLQGLDTLIVSALRHRPHSTHFNVEQAVQAAARLAPRKAYFTHIADDLEHHATNAALPDWARLLHDGQLIEIDGSPID